MAGEHVAGAYGIQPAQTVGPAFSSSRIVRFSDLADEDKDAFVKFLAEQRVQFFKDLDGSYVANVRLFDPNVIDMAPTNGRAVAQKKDSKRGRQSGRGGAAGGGSGEGGDDEDAAAGRSASEIGGSAAALSYSGYARLTSLISPRDSAKPKQRPLAWLMRLIEEVYDHRYARDTAELRGEAEGGNGVAEEGGAASTPFPVFIVDFFSKRYGLRSLIDQTCWDLLSTVHSLRKDFLEVEVFARFMEEYYDPDDLLFFLYVRSVTQKELGISFRGRWSELGATKAAAAAAGGGGGEAASAAGGPPPLYLTARECTLVSRVVFGSESDPLYRTFMAVLERHLTGSNKSKPAAGAAGAASRVSSVGAPGDNRRIEANQFLHLALVEYHETRPSAAGGSNGGASSPAAEAAEVAASKPAAAAAAASPAPSTAAPQQLSAAAPAASAAPSSYPSSSSSSGAGLVTPEEMLKRIPQFFDTLGEAINRASGSYLDSLLQPSAVLPQEVGAQIRAEAHSQLDAKVDTVLANTIKASKSGVPSGNPARDALVAQFQQLMQLVDAQQQQQASGELQLAAQGAASAALEAFCGQVLEQEEVRGTIEPLVSLLTTYAISKIQDETVAAAAAGGM